MKKFEKIKEEFQKIDIELQEKSDYAVRDTSKGTWGPADLDVLFVIFERLKLSEYDSFIDLGAGDGRVVALASLFTESYGIDVDEELIEKGKKIINKLDLDEAHLKSDDYTEYDLSEYDIIFINPDKPFYRDNLENKLMNELSEELWVYNKIFLPEKLKRGRTHWFNRVPVTVFTKE